MRGVILAASLAITACDSPSWPVDEPHCPPVVAGPFCSDSCGNARVEQCFVRETAMGCEINLPVNEVCDTAPVDCITLGYFAGEAACDHCTAVLAATCDPCAPTDLACRAVWDEPTSGLVVSGSAIALIGATSIQLLDSTLAVGPAVMLTAKSLVPTPTGWLALTTGGIRAISYDGTVGTPFSLFASNVAIGPGPSGLYLGAFSNHAVLLDSTGRSVGLPFTTGLNGWTYAAGTDGVHGLVGAGGNVAFVGADGHVDITSGDYGVGGTDFDDVAMLLHAAATSWYVYGHAGGDRGGWTVRAFDLNGDTVGPTFQILGTATSFIADGDELLAIRSGASTGYASPVELLSFAVDGTVTSSTVVGAGIGTAGLGRLGGDLVVSWIGPGRGTQLARIARP